MNARIGFVELLEKITFCMVESKKSSFSKAGERSYRFAEFLEWMTSLWLRAKSHPVQK